MTSERGNSWALITLSSSAGLNKLGTETLIPLLEEVRTNLSGSCRCLGITGVGGSFAVGADLKEIASLTPATAREFSKLGNSLLKLLEDQETIVVAGIDGFCLGGGLDLALAADWRMATPRSVFGHPGADLGLITGFGGTQRLPRLIGTKKAVSWLFTANRVDTAEAYEAGFLQEVCKTTDFHKAVTDRIRMFAGLSSSRLREIKKGFRRYSDGWMCGGENSASVR